MKPICFLDARVTGVNLLAVVSLTNVQLTSAELDNSNLFDGTLTAANLISAELNSGNLMTAVALSNAVYCSGSLYYENNNELELVQCKDVQLIPPQNSQFKVSNAVVTSSKVTGGKLNSGHIIKCGRIASGKWSGGAPPSNSPWEGYYVDAKLKNAEIIQAGLISVDLQNPILESSTVNVMGATYAVGKLKNGIYSGGKIS